MCEFSTPGNSLILCGHQPDILQFNSILPQTTQSQSRPHKLGAIPQACPPLQTPFASSGSPSYPHFCPTWVQVGGSHDRLLRFDNLLGGLIEFRKPAYLLLPVYYRRWKSGIAGWKKRTGQGVREGAWRASVPSAGTPPSQHQGVFHQPGSFPNPVI